MVLICLRLCLKEVQQQIAIYTIYYRFLSTQEVALGDLISKVKNNTEQLLQREENNYGRVRLMFDLYLLY